MQQKTMTDSQTQLLAREVLSNAAAVGLLTQITVNVLERAVDLGCFDERANLLRSDAEQLLASLKDEAQQAESLRVLFDLPKDPYLCPA